MFPSKLCLTIVAAIMGIISITNEVQAAQERRDLVAVNVGHCKPMLLRDSYLMNDKNTGLIDKVGNDLYEARDSKGNLKWVVSTNPLRISSFKGQIGPYNAVTIVIGIEPFVFMIGEGQTCIETLYQPYSKAQHSGVQVTKVLHHGLDKFPNY